MEIARVGVVDPRDRHGLIEAGPRHVEHHAKEAVGVVVDVGDDRGALAMHSQRVILDSVTGCQVGGRHLDLGQFTTPAPDRAPHGGEVTHGLIALVPGARLIAAPAPGPDPDAAAQGVIATFFEGGVA